MPDGQLRTPAADRATVLVHLPDDARLYVDGQPAPPAPSIQAFATPPLEPGRSYAYTFQVEARHNDQTVADSRRVRVQAGRVTRVDFGDVTSAAVRTPSEPGIAVAAGAAAGRAR